MANSRSHRTKITPDATAHPPVSTLVAVEVLKDCPLAILKEAMQALSEAETFDDVKKIHDHAEALRIYARSAALGLEVQNRAAELRLRAERKAGEQLRDSGLKGGDRRSKSHDATLKLADLGVTKQQAHRWRRVAHVSAPDFEQYFRQCGNRQKEITGAGLLRTTSGG